MRERDFGFPDEVWTRDLIRRALAEDVGSGDASTEVTVPEGQRARSSVTARESGILAGLPLLEILFAELDGAVRVELLRADGDPVRAGDVAARLEGPAGSLLTGERTALNFLQHLGGIATLAGRYAERVAATGCRVLDTRKTLPGYRHLAKYAVRCGGGHNHRMGLYDRIMLKDNHWAAAGGSITDLVLRARERHPGLAVEVEVDTLQQLEKILPLRVEWILLDNFTPQLARRAVQLRDDAGVQTLLEASGNVTLDTVGEFARAGVDAASVGRLTHSAPALDLGMDMELLS
jgi:nicotinate-nucleotide pyrophosphorylase (carboxylating)